MRMAATLQFPCWEISLSSYEADDDGECLGSSDHNIINFTLVTQVTRPLQPSKLVYNYKNANWDCFRTELYSAPWDSVFADNNIDNIWERWKHLFFKAVRNNIPSKRIKPRKNVPWITSHIRRLFHKRKRLWKRAKASNNQNDWNNYRRIRNQTKSELNKSYWLHVSSLIESKNPKRFWSFIKSKTKYQSVPPTVQLNDEVASTAADKAQLFNNFFLSIFNESDTAPPSTEAHTPLEDVIGDLICQEPDVTKILLSLNTNKACGPDGVTARLLREASSSIVPSLTRLFNSSLALGKLPCEWKNANVSPIFKKGDKELVCNYRPISLTCLLVKVLEKLVASHISSFINSKTLLSDHQFGFRTGSSCTSQLIHIFHSWASALDSGKLTDVVFFDFAKAFDSVSHKHLLAKLQLFGINGNILLWLSDFLYDRKQRVVIDGAFSDWGNVISGVPQGSILGPLLFVLYVNDIPQTLSCSSEMFADDTLLYNSDSIDIVSAPVQQGLHQMSDWCSSWSLNLNIDKCEFMRITRSRAAATCSYNINSTPLMKVSSHKQLGVTLSCDLSWKSHVLSVAAKANRVLGLLKRTFGRCSEAIKMGYISMVRPMIEYACPAWNPHQQYLSDKLERIQRNASRWILSKDITYDERLSKLRWMYLKTRRNFLSLIQLFKYNKGFCIVNLDDYVKFSSCRTRCTNRYKIWKPYARTNILKYSFWHRYIDEWNSLPKDIVEAVSVSNFKRRLYKMLIKDSVSH